LVDLPKFTQNGIFGLKKYHLATLPSTGVWPRQLNYPKILIPPEKESRKVGRYGISGASKQRPEIFSVRNRLLISPTQPRQEDHVHICIPKIPFWEYIFWKDLE
jgi:hypothetical protein